jgi:hypothetical protein
VRRLQLDLVVPLLLAATLVAFATGSSSVVGIVRVGHAARWVALFALFAAAALLSLRRHALARLRAPVITTALVFLGIAVESAIWSVNPRLTLERAATLVVLFATAAAIAAVCAGDLGRIRRMLWGIAAGAFIVTGLGLVVLVVDHPAAVEQATFDLPARYRGFGENPNTVSLLLALCLPVVTWLAFQARSRTELALAVGAGVAFDASIAASGSRGGIAAGFAGTFLVVALMRSPVRARLGAAAALGVLLAATIAVALAPTSKGEAAYTKPPPSAAPSGPQPKPGYLNVQGAYPLEFDIGSQGPGEAAPTHRALFGLTGRGEAWRGALDQANARPALGYGFGTEDRVFVDRYANFAAGLPENSYIGVFLQLGAVGLVAFGVLVACLALVAVRERTRPEAILSLGVLVSALVLGLVQSYIYAVGDIGTVAVWVCVFLGVAAVGRRVTV